ncbi:response regulator [Pseudoalteromonas sp. MMG012]|uniref:response regulator n=1 Tax=Pseudoalteromonas sp. MMG012 TaxID=2822686 RepID=UPI001B39FC03|nr:response regulator [Pseudoalteromonas sp. MMG012]MBQ4850337.1 response regulator [Pseudoalteromonas sp. MMG012]
MKILIVDDSHATLEIVKRGLEKFGYRKLLIQKANSAKSALQYIGSWKPDIVLTDWHMPDMSGLILLQAIKQRQLNITVAMITTVDEQSQIDQALEAGASFVLSKPFSDDELHEKLLPLVQGAEENEIILDDIEVNGELALPKLSQLERLIHKHIDESLCIKPIQSQVFDETKVPCVMAVYEDRESQKVRAIGLLDIYATCVMASGIRMISEAEAQQAIHQNLVSSEILEAGKEALSATAFAFLDKKTRMSLRIKTVKFIASPFRKLELLYQTQADSRIDFSCQRDGMALGKILLVGF